MQHPERPPPYSSLECVDKPPAYSPSVPPPAFQVSAHPSYLQLTAQANVVVVASHAYLSFNVPCMEWENASRPTCIHCCPVTSADHFILTLVMMLICGFLLNLFSFLFLIPALLYSRKAAEANSQLDYTLAKKLSQRSLCLNIAAAVSFIILLLVIGVSLGTILAFT